VLDLSIVSSMLQWSNLANNLFASSCDNLHPIIAFGLPLAIKLVAFSELA